MPDQYRNIFHTVSYWDAKWGECKNAYLLFRRAQRSVRDFNAWHISDVFSCILIPLFRIVCSLSLFPFSHRLYIVASSDTDKWAISKRVIPDATRETIQWNLSRNSETMELAAFDTIKFAVTNKGTISRLSNVRYE